MFEYDQYDSARHSESVQAPRAASERNDDVTQISLLVWGEHCIECAAPACFETCDLYETRPDGRCRRFKYGAFKNESFRSLRGWGTEIAFKKWAKIECRGNAAVAPVQRIIFYERALEAVAPLIRLIGRAVYRFTKDARWLSLNRALHERIARRLHVSTRSDKLPDAFVVELFNPELANVRLRLTIAVASTNQDDSRLPPFQATLDLPPGYSKHDFALPLFERLLNSRLPFDMSITPEGDSDARVVITMCDFVRYRTRPQESKPNVKCVVWDLDNTLWDGILLEHSDVQLRPGISEILQTLDRRGILLSIASKNHFDDAWTRLKHLGVAEYFLHPQINWLPKSRNIETVAKALNIGLDTFAFIDDTPYELAEVARSLPEVATIPADAVETVREDPRFAGSGSVDSRKRRQYYRDAIQRSAALNAFSGDQRDFVAESQLELEIANYQPTDHQRVVELVQRTNQLNFSGRKYTRPEIEAILSEPANRFYVLHCRDRYGSYGTVGFAIVDPSTDVVRVRDFMLSCRVQGRFVEQAFFDYVASRDSVKRMEVTFHRTGRNEPARQTLERLNFENVPTQDLMTLDVKQHPLTCEFIKVRVR